MPRAAAGTSPRKVDRPRLANQDDLDLARVLKLRLDAPRDLLGHRRHANVIDVVWHDDDAHFATGLDGVDLIHTLVAGRDPLEALQPLHIRLERFAACAGPRPRDRVRRLHEHRDLTLVRYVVVVRGDAIHDQRVLSVLRRDLDA